MVTWSLVVLSQDSLVYSVHYSRHRVCVNGIKSIDVIDLMAATGSVVEIQAVVCVRHTMT